MSISSKEFGEALERSSWGNFTHQEIFARDFLVGRHRKAKEAGPIPKKSRMRQPACVYVFRAGKVTLGTHPDEPQVGLVNPVSVLLKFKI